MIRKPEGNSNGKCELSLSVRKGCDWIVKFACECAWDVNTFL